MVAPSFDYEYVASGGVTLSSTDEFTSSGGISVLGGSDVVSSAQSWLTSGGITTGGEADRIVNPLLRTSEGGVVVDGLAGITAEYPNYDPDNGSELNAQGSSDIILTFSYSGNGGITMSGQAETPRISSGSGGVVISGESVILSSSHTWSSSGGLSLSGDALERPENYIGSGGVSISGTSAAFISGYNEIAQGSLAVSKESYVDIISGDDPIAYWKLDESSGAATAVNSGTLGTAVDGSYTNFPLVGQTGIVQTITSPNKSVEFDGVNDYVSIPNNSSINTGTSYTNKSFELWFEADTVSGRQTIYEQGGSRRGVHAYILDGSLYAYGYSLVDEDATTPWETVLSVPVDKNQTYHLVITFDQTGNAFKAYLNGEEFGSGSCGVLFSHGGDVRIGGAPTDTRYADVGPLVGNYFNGKINHVSLQNRTLSALEIQQHYSSGVNNFRMILSQEASGGLSIGGESVIGSTNPIIVSGQADVLTTAFGYIPEGGVVVSGSAVTDSYGYTSSGGFALAGESDAGPVISHESSGGIIVSGEADLARRFVASGGITLKSPSLFVLMSGNDSAVNNEFSPDGAVGFWPLNEGSGTVARNRSSLGSSENGTYQGLIEWESGLIPTESPLVAGFGTPADDRVDRSDGAELRASGDKSIEMWIRPSSLSGTQAIYTTGNSTIGFNVYLFGSALYVGAWDTTNSWQAFLKKVNIESGEIYHIVATFSDSTSFKLYLDGEEVASEAAVGAMSTIPAGIGYISVRGSTRLHTGAVSGIGNLYQGRVGYVASYNRVLSQSEIDLRQSYAYLPYSLLIPSESDGGITIEGQSEWGLVFDTSGGATVAGEAVTTTTDFVVIATGGLTISGESVTSNSSQRSAEGSGGVALGGISGSADLLRITGGGATISGESLTTRSPINFEGSGGLVLNGDSAEQEQYFVTSSGGASVSGEADLTPHITATGGSIISGESDAGMTNISVEGSGGLVLNGDSVEQEQYFVTGSGGVAIGGSSDAYVSLYIAEGGVLLSGQANSISSSYVFESSGGLSTLGSSSVRGDWLARGGFSLNGESNIYVTRQIDGEGGVLLSGQANSISSSYVFEPSGGLVLNGDSIEQEQYFVTSSGGISASGEADLTPHITATGGLSFNPITLSDLITGSDAIGFWKFNESFGTTADNLGTEGSSIDGEYIGPIDLGSPSIIQSTTDTSIDLSAIDSDRVLVPDSDAINTGGPYVFKSIEIWFLPTKSPYAFFNQNMPLWHQGVGGPSPEVNDFGHGIWIDYGSHTVVNPARGNYLDIWIYDSTTDPGIAEPWSLRIGGGFTPNAGGSASDFVANWDEPHQVVVTFESNWPASGATLKAYLNGELIGTQTTTKLARLYDDRGACTGCYPSGDRNWIGAHLGYVTQNGPASPRFFDGQLQYVAYWNSALTAEDVSNHFNAGYYLYSMSIPYSASGGVEVGGSSHLARAYGGVTVSGEADVLNLSDRFIEGTGGVNLSGEARAGMDAYFVEASGGLTVSGDSVEQEQYFTEGSGGILLSGQADIESSSFSFESTGELIISGDAIVRPGNWVATGGFNISGESSVSKSLIFVASGGLDVSGESSAIITDFGYVGLGGVVISGDSVEEVENYEYISSGGITLSGSSDGGIVFYFESSGGISVTENIFNKTEVVVSFGWTQDFQWGVNGEVFSFQNFQWDVGEQPLQFYRVEGDCLQPDCDNATFDDGETCTQGKRFFQTVVAKSVSDVCERLKEAYFSYPMIWPIKSIKRYSRPANLNDIAAQEAAGINHDCLELIEEEFCQIPECWEFCLAEQPQVSMGMNVIIQDSFRVYEATGGLFVEGDALFGNYEYEATGGLVAVGGSDPISSSWSYEPIGGLLMAGVAGLASEFYSYLGSGSLEVSGTVVDSSSSYSYTSSSGILLEGSAVQKVVLDFVPLYPLISVLGEATVVTPDFAYYSTGGVSVSGESTNLSGYHPYEGDGGLIISGNSETISSAISYTSSGGLSVSGEYSIAWAFESTGGISASGSSLIGRSYESSGGVTLGGSSDILSSAYSAFGSGGISLEGEADAISSFFDVMAYIGAETELVEEEAVFPGLIAGDTTDTLTIDEGTVATTCGCNPLPLTISLKNNLINSGLLQSFSALNNLTFPDVVTLRHDSLNDSWRNNLQYTGVGLDGSTQERWTFLFEFGCNTSDVLTEGVLPTPNWKLSLYIKRKNLVTLEDSDTRLLYTLGSNGVCQNDKLDFTFILDVDTKNPFIEGDNSYVVDYQVFHDTMGFFSSGGWLKNPELKIQISESPLSSGVRRVDIFPLFSV